MKYLSDEWLAWSEAVNEIKREWPSDSRNPNIALAFLEKSRTMRPRNTHAKMLWHELRAMCLDDLGRRDEAVAEALKAIALYVTVTFNSCWGLPWSVLINAAMARRDYAAARRWVQRAIDVFKRLPDEFGKPNDPSVWEQSLRMIDEAEAFDAFIETIRSDISKAAPVVQADFCKTHPSGDPDRVRWALARLEESGFIKKTKQGRSFLISLA